MTLRESIAGRKRSAAIVTYSALVCFVAALVAGGSEPPWSFAAATSFVVFLAGTLYLLFGVRCPRCHGAIGYIVSYLSGPFSISRRIRFCPFCGATLDSEWVGGSDV